jgi:hypothetical protein
VKIIEAFSRIWPEDRLGSESHDVINALTSFFLWCITIIGGDLGSIQPRTVGKEVLDRHTLVLGQCLTGEFIFSALENVLPGTFVG